MVENDIESGDIALRGWTIIRHFDKYGNLVDERVGRRNKITNAGKAMVAGLINWDALSGCTQFNWIAVGLSATPESATDTALGGEITGGGGARADAIGSRVQTSYSNDTSQWVALFSFTGSYSIVESGVFNQATGGTMLCRQTFAPINVSPGDSLQITWRCQISATV